MSTVKGTRAQHTAALIWFCALLLGSVALGAYAHRPGARGAAPEAWPGAVLGPRSERATLVVFAHPHCPCTRASVETAEELAREAEGAMDVRVVFSVPPAADDDWSDTALVRAVEASPLLEARWDRGGDQALACGAHTSGHALLFTADGRLAYDGGLTPSRGHAGSFRGTAAILDALDSAPNTPVRLAVLGCPLHDRAPRTP